MDNYPEADDPIPEMGQPHYQELLDFLRNNSEMKKAARHALQQGLWSGSGAVAGGMMAGPVGGLIGGITGALLGFFHGDNYDGVLQHVAQLERPGQQRLLKTVGGVLTSAGASASQFTTPDAFRTTLISLVAQPQVRDQIWKAVNRIVEEEQ